MLKGVYCVVLSVFFNGEVEKRIISVQSLFAISKAVVRCTLPVIGHAQSSRKTQAQTQETSLFKAVKNGLDTGEKPNIIRLPFC